VKGNPDVLPAPIPDRRPSRWEVAAVVALLTIYFALAVSAIATKCATADELFHLTGGYTYWRTGDFRIQPENGNLPQRWAALPLLLGDYHLPSFDQDAWRQSRMDEFGIRFFYDSGNDADAMLLRGRAMIAAVGVALGLLVFHWSRRLWGWGAGLISLTLYAFCPTVLNNGALVTSDMMAAFFFLASISMIWVILHHVTWIRLLVSSLVMAGLFVSKFSAFMIIPMGLLLMGWQLATRTALVITWRQHAWQIRSRLARLAAQLAIVALHGVVIWGVIWASFDFRFALLNPQTSHTPPGAAAAIDRTMVPWEELASPDGGAVDRVLLAMRDVHFLPEGYLFGAAHTFRYAQQRQAFLNGEYRLTGWPQFFPYCLMVKTPLTLFVALGLGGLALASFWRQVPPRERAARIRSGLYRVAPLLVLFVVYWAFAITSHLNIGHRHILPTYPLMFILAGASVWWLLPRAVPGSGKSKSGAAASAASSASPSLTAPPRGGWRSWLASRRQPALAAVTLVSLGLFATESLAHWPNYLAYFNPLIGSSRHAYRHLVDSSLDWGQDLPGLKKWLDQQTSPDGTPPKAYLSYFGPATPAYYGIQATLLPSFGTLETPGIPQPLEPGLYCISATMLQNLFTQFPGRWSRAYEQDYQNLSANLRLFHSTADDPAARQRLIAQAGGRDAVLAVFQSYADARFARLCGMLRQREPDAEINHSILIYRLTAEDLARALDGPPVELVDNPFARPPAGR